MAATTTERARPSKAAARRAAEAWLELQDRRLALARQVDALEREQRLHHAVAAEFLGDDESVDLGAGIEVRHEAGQARVNWKDSFIAECGAAAAAKLQQSAVAPQVVRIRRA